MMTSKHKHARIRKEMDVQCPSSETLGCPDFKCTFDRNVCGMECMDEVVPCIMCKVKDGCEKPTKEQLVYIHRTEETKKELLESHDALQREIMDIHKFWKSLKMTQKWTAREKLKDLVGQLKGIRYALHKLGVPYTPQYRTNMKSEKKMVEFLETREEGDPENG